VGIKTIQWFESRGEGFRLYKIQSNPSYDARWDVSYSEEELQHAQKVLAQPFHYLAHGFQCYAFESEDGNYVLKFFRHQRLRLPQFVMALPECPFFSEWRKSRQLALGRRRDYLFRSCRTSWQLAKKETAMLMVHLNLTKNLFPMVTIVDALGNSYDLDLDSYQFMLQRKAQLIKPTIRTLMREGDEEKAKQYLATIFDLFLTCVRKGIVDKDGALIRKDNLGFLDDHAMYIDGGKLAPRKAACTKEAFIKDLRRLRPLYKWLREEFPLLAEYFSQIQTEAIEKMPMIVQQQYGNDSKRSTYLCDTRQGSCEQQR